MVMAEQGQHSYRFLDAEEDRQALIKDIHQTREELRKVVDLVPPDQWYVPRYHGWSLAAMLGHLELMDRLNLWLLSLAALSIQVPLPISAVKGFNEMVAMVYKNRRVEGSSAWVGQEGRADCRFYPSSACRQIQQACVRPHFPKILHHRTGNTGIFPVSLAGKSHYHAYGR